MTKFRSDLLVRMGVAACVLTLSPLVAFATETAPAPESAPAAAAPGTLVIVADADGLVAEVAGAVTGLKKGDNALQVPAGKTKVVVRNTAGQLVKEAEIAVESSATARLEIVTRGRIEVSTLRGAKVEVDGKPVPAKEGKAETEVDMGAHSLVITRPGYFGRKGTVELGAGQKATVAADLSVFEPENDYTPYAWGGIAGGGALILAAVAIDALADYDDVGGDAVRWTLMGLGTAGFVTGTILLKKGAEAKANPPIQEEPKFDIRLSRTQGGAAARLAVRF